MATANCVSFTTSDNRIIILNDRDIFGRDSTAMSKRISRQVFSIKSIKTSQIINNNNKNGKVAICELQLLKKSNYIRINNIEYRDDQHPIPIHDGDILNLVQAKYEKQQFWLKASKIENRKRKRSEPILLTDSTQSPSKKRKISDDFDDEDTFSFTKKPKQSLKDLENTWNKLQNHTNNNYIDEDEDENYDIALLENTLPPTQDIALLDNSDDIEHAPIATPSVVSDTAQLMAINLQQQHIVYSDGVWCILVPTNDKNSSVLISCDKFTIGREGSNDLIFGNNIKISGTHCCIIDNKIRKKILLQDSSTNGTYINKSKILKYRERELKNGDFISFAEVEELEFYYFHISAYFECCNCGNNENESESEEFNVRLKKINSKYYLTMNGKEMVYDESFYEKKCLSKCITDIVDIPINISNVIVDCCGGIMDIIAYNIGSKRPKKVINRPPLRRSFAMCGSPTTEQI